MELSALRAGILRRIEPAMRTRGFGRGGPGWSPGGSHSFLWCIGADDFVQRWPATAAALRRHGDITPHPSACVDLTLGLTAHGSVDRFDLEFVAVAVVLDQLGFGTVAARLDAMDGAVPSPDDAISVILEVVEALLPA